MADSEVVSSNTAEDTSFATEIQEIAGLDDAKREERIAAKLEEAVEQKKEGKTEALAERVRLMLDLAKGSLTPEQLVKFRESLGKVQSQKAEEIGKDGNVLNAIDTKAQQYLPLEMSTNAKRATAGVAGVAAVIAAIKWGPKLVAGAVKGVFEWTIMKPLRWVGRGLKKLLKPAIYTALAIGGVLGIAKLFGVDLGKLKDDLMGYFKIVESIQAAEQKAKEALAKAKEEAARLKADAEKLQGDARVKADAIAQAAEQKVTELTKKVEELGEKAKAEAMETAKTATAKTAETAKDVQADEMPNVWAREMIALHKDAAMRAGLDAKSTSDREVLSGVLALPAVRALPVKELLKCDSAESGQSILRGLLPGVDVTTEMGKVLYFLAEIAREKDAQLQKLSPDERAALGDSASLDGLSVQEFLESTSQVNKFFSKLSELLAGKNLRDLNPKDFKDLTEKLFNDSEQEFARMLGDPNVRSGFASLSSNPDAFNKRFGAFTVFVSRRRNDLAGVKAVAKEGEQEEDVKLFGEVISKVSEYLQKEEVVNYLALYTHGREDFLEPLKTKLTNLNVSDAMQLYALIRMTESGGALPNSLEKSSAVSAFLLQMKALNLISKQDDEKGYAMMNFLLIDVIRGAKNVNLPPETIELLLKTGEFLGKEFYEEAFEWLTDMLVMAGITVEELSMAVVDDLPALLDWMMENKLITGGGLLVAMWLRRRVGVVGPLWARWRPTHMPKSLKVWKKGSWKVDHPGIRSLAHMSSSQIANHYGVDEKTADIIKTRVESTYKQLYTERGFFRRNVLSRKIHLDLFSDIDLICITGDRKGKSGGLARADVAVIGGQYGIDVTTDEGRKLAEEIHRESLAFDTEYRATGTLGKTADYLRSRAMFLSTAADRARVLRKSFAKRVSAYHAAKGIVHAPEVDTEDTIDQTTESEQTTDTKVETAKPVVTPALDPKTEQRLADLEKAQREAQAKPAPAPSVDTEAERQLRTELKTGLASVKLAQQETQRLQEDLRLKAAELDRKIAANGEADSQQITELRRELDLARAELVVARDQATQSIAKTEEARAKLESELTTRIKGLETQQKEQKGRTEVATDSVVSVQDSFEAMQGEIDTLKQEVSDLRKASQLELQKATKALSDKVEALESSQAKAATAQETLAQKTVALQKAQEKNAGDTKNLTDEVTKARTEVAKVQQDVIVKAKAAEQARSEVEARLQGQVDVLGKAADEARAEARTTTTAQGETVTKLQQELGKANEQLAAQKKAAGEAALELDRRLSKMQGDLETSIRILGRESDAAKAKQADLTEALRLENENNGKNVAKIEGELKAVTERATALEQELALAKSQQTELATQVEQVKKKQSSPKTAEQRNPNSDGDAGATSPMKPQKGPPDNKTASEVPRTSPRPRAALPGIGNAQKLTPVEAAGSRSRLNSDGLSEADRSNGRGDADASTGKPKVKAGR